MFTAPSDVYDVFTAAALTTTAVPQPNTLQQCHKRAHCTLPQQNTHESTTALHCRSAHYNSSATREHTVVAVPQQNTHELIIAQLTRSRFQQRHIFLPVFSCLTIYCDHYRACLTKCCLALELNMVYGVTACTLNIVHVSPVSILQYRLRHCTMQCIEVMCIKCFEQI